ncbi:MAG TPA: NAD-dependent epimerase/dehydratase family protein [Chryseolinea sp.]
MKVLVTGANGLLGANLSRALVQRGDKVKAFVRPEANMKSLEGVKCEVHRGSILSAGDISLALKDCDAVIHAASTTSVVPNDFSFYEKTNVDSTKIIVQAVLGQGSKRLVHVSTANAFDPGPKENPGTESSPFTLDKFNSGYINSKRMAQEYVIKQVESRNLDAVVVNPTFIIGPYDAKPSSGKIIFFGLRYGMRWCPPGGKNFVHVQDVVEGIECALKVGRKGECYLLGAENLTYQEFFTLLNRIIGRAKKPYVLPRKIVHAAGAVAEAWNKLTGQKKPFNKANAQLLSLDNYYSSKKAEVEFNLKRRPIVTAVEDALEWFKTEKFITSDYSTQGTSLDL